jgi:erythronate-4-phosphate dehydrogenase
VPQPQYPEIMIDGKGKSDEDVTREAILHTYNIKDDDDKLRFSPSGFEKQRGDYPLRREFPSYTVKLTNSSINVRSMLEKTGFNIIV